MSIVNQYKPQVPQSDNALHQLQLKRMAARAEADAAWCVLKKHVGDIVHPKPARTEQSFIGRIVSHAGTIMAGVQVGSRIIAAIRGYKRR